MDAAKGIVSLNDISDLELKQLIEEEVSVDMFFFFLEAALEEQCF